MAGRGVVRGGGWRWLTAPFSPDGLAFLALAGFSILSAVATAQGFADLRSANSDSERLGWVDLVATYALSAFVIAAMIVALHNAFAPGVRWWIRIVSLVFYLFFAVWSVGFGYGFFWKELAGQEFTRSQFETMLVNSSRSLSGAGLALETAEQAALGAADLARRRAEIETAEGGTCANRPGSTPGDGPLTRGRFQFAERAAAVAEDVRTVWIAPLSLERERLERRMTALRAQRVAAANADEQAVVDRLADADRLPARERRALYLGVHDEIRQFTDQLNAMRDLHAAAFAGRLMDLAAEVGPRADGLADAAACRDSVLEDRLTAAAKQLGELRPMDPPRFEFLEGPKATREAFFGLADVMQHQFGRPRETGFPFGAREAMALFASLAVDLGIVFLTLIRLAPRRRPPADPGVGAPQPPVLSTILP